MVQITLSNPTPNTVPANGWKVGYRIKGSTGAYITPTNSPFTTFPIVFQTTDPAGTLYEGYIKRDCGSLESTVFLWQTSCNCTTSGYVVDELGTGCKKTESIPAMVTNSNFCLAPSVNAVYSSYGSRVYNFGFTLSDIIANPGTVNPNINMELSATPQWNNPTSDPTIGPMNREGVWVDSNCDGNRDSLTITSGSLVVGATYQMITYNAGDDFTNVGGTNSSGGTFVATGTTPTRWTNGSIIGVYKTTIAFTFNNTDAARVVYVGIGGDNQFKLQVNSIVIIDTGTTPSDKQFKMWHIIPVNLIVGVNYFNVIAIGDGSINDSIAMVVYDNTLLQLSSATSDTQLNILYKTSSLRGTTYDVATCQSGYNLDSSGGRGNYTCTRVLRKPCNTAT